MDLHKKFENSLSVDFSLVSNVQSYQNPKNLMDELIKSYDQKLIKGNLNLNSLKSYHMLLCNKYQAEKRLELPDKKIQDLSKTSDIILKTNKLSTEELSIIYEIIVLKLVLFTSNIYEELEDVQRKFSNYFEEEETKHLYLKIVECFLDAVQLNPELGEGKDLSLIILRDLETCYAARNPYWKSLISILPKLIKITGLESLRGFWNFLLQLRQNLKSTLTNLCIFIQTALNSETERKNLALFFPDKRLWDILLNGLRSQVEVERKESLYLFKIATEFLQKEKVDREPFKCKKSTPDYIRNFILVLESLEEKQQHLVIPSLSLLNSLLSGQHRDCKSCFNFPWLHCIFEKILHHENNAVIKFGVSYILKLDPQLFDDLLLESLTKTLSNRFLYENENQQIGEPPQIVTELGDLFILAEKTKVKLVEDFLSAIENISWDPVSIFNVTLALRSASEKITKISFPWKKIQMAKIKSLAEKSSKLHSRLLREETLINIIFAIIRFSEDVDLNTLWEILSVFPSESFSRGTKIWKAVSDLEEIIKKSDVEKFCREACKDIKNGDLKELSIESFAKLFVILLELNILKRESVQEVIDLLQLIDSLDTRAYIDSELVDRVSEFICYFMINIIPDPGPAKELARIVSPYIEHTIWLARSCNFEKVEKYSSLVDLLLKKVFDGVPETIFKSVMQHLERSNLYEAFRRLYVINVLHTCQKFRKLSGSDISSLLRVHLCPLRFNEQESLSGIKGKVVTQYSTVVGMILNSQLAKCPNNFKQFQNLVVVSLALFNAAGTSVVPSVVGILSKLLENKLVPEEDLEGVKSLVRKCWESTFEAKKTRLFWAAFAELMKLRFNSKCFGFEDEIVEEFVVEILEEEAAPTLKIELLKRFEDWDPKWLSQFQKPILDCLLHGQALRRDVKIELQTIGFINEKNSPETENQDCKFYLNHNLDLEVRTRAIVLIIKLITSVENYSSSLFPLVIASLRKFKGKRYFSDSNAHRIQQRIFQLLLILQPFLDEDCSEKLKQEITEIVVSNADQLSIQIMMSWILTRIYSKEADKTSLWNFFREVKEKRPGNIKIVAGVIFHVSKLVKDDFESFFEAAVSLLAPECLGPNFNTRLACQIVIVELYNVIEKKDVLYKSIVEMMDERNFKIANEFYYNNFHPLENYSLESIYYEVPRLTNMSSDELIPPKAFKALKFVEREQHALKLFDETNSLRSVLLATTTKSTEQNEISSINESFDLQKKIIPQTSTILEGLKSQNSEFEEINREEGIIVVASLVDKIPNLGGLARTCEIFGASELVLENKKSTENKEFQSLSVTAEKWIKITEVKPPDLSKYLLQMQEKGWKLVGLEQTAYSSSLLGTKFEKKTLLLLGHEKDGIPPHLIPILDTCVEIPQVGVVRSLNVHVTGAICIWEYAKQHSFK